MDEILNQVGKHEVFAMLSKDELAGLSPIVKNDFFEEGEIVFDINKKPQFLFLIQSGSFTLHLANNEYKTLLPGELMGEIGVINGDFRSGTVSAAEASTAISICGTRLFREEFVPSGVALKIVKALSKRITNYLRSKEQVSTLEIIQEGENEFVEFKSTLRWNLFANKKDKAIENASLKTLAAFMNSKGGMLMIGVADDGELLGLEKDNFPNHDKLLLHLTALIKERIGALFLNYLHFSIEVIGGKDVLRIDCSPAHHPAYMKTENQEHFYIRTGPATTDLRLSKVYDYINERFGKKLD